MKIKRIIEITEIDRVLRLYFLYTIYELDNDMGMIFRKSFRKAEYDDEGKRKINMHHVIKTEVWDLSI